MMTSPAIDLYLIPILFQKYWSESFFLALIIILGLSLLCVVFSLLIENFIPLKLLYCESIMIYFLPLIRKRSLLLSCLIFRQPLTLSTIRFYLPGLTHPLVSLALLSL